MSAGGESDPTRAARRLVFRNYGGLFAGGADRRVYALEGRPLPVPGGLPIAAAGYVVGLVVAVVLASRAPVLGELLGLVPAPLTYVLLPITLGWLAWRFRPDGRTLPAWAAIALAYRLRARIAARGHAPRTLAGGLPVWVRPDLSGPMVRGRLRAGAAPARLQSALALRAEGGRLVSDPAGHTRITLATGQSVEIRP